MYGGGQNWAAHNYQAPHQSHPSEDFRYGEFPLDFLEQNTEFYPQDAIHGVDRQLSKHLSLGTYGNPGIGQDPRNFQWGGAEEEDYGSRRGPRHARSMSMGVDVHHPPEQLRRNFQRQPFQQSFPQSSGRGGRLPFAGRSGPPQVSPSETSYMHAVALEHKLPEKQLQI